MIGGTSDANADAEIELPLGIQIEVDGGKNLVLLLAQWQKFRGGADGVVVFDAGVNFFGES
jgi:hypothetical protein